MLRILPCLLLLTALSGICLGASPAVPIPNGPIASAFALVETNRVPEAMKALEGMAPGFLELGPYHYVYGRALAASGDPLEAALHYHRASVYATVPQMQETALLTAAETEFHAGFRFEAKTDCLIFLKRFPESAQAARVRILLGRSLAGIGRHRDAVRQFEMAGGSPESLFGKANALQRMGMTIEAARVYSDAMARDERFPERDDETRLWMGENLRLSGLAPRAKDLLSKVTARENRDYAAFGLAEIAAEESKADNAVRMFGALASSKDRKLGRMAALRASDVEAAAGKAREAAARLEEIVAKYPFTPEYDQAMLRLARMRSAAGDDAAALSLLARLVVRPSTVRGKALDEIERALLAGRAKGPAQLAALWNAGGRWLMDPSREPTLVLVADDLRGTGPHEELVQWLSRYGSAPVRSRYLTQLAARYAASGDVKELRTCLQGLRTLNASGDAVIRAEAYLKFAEKDYAGAERALLSLGRMEEGDVAMLADLLPLSADPRKAMAAVETAASRTGAPPRVLVRLADEHYEAGRRDEAIRYYRMAAEKDPENEWSCYRLSVLLGKDGGDEYVKRIRRDPALVRMANAARKERNLDAR